MFNAKTTSLLGLNIFLSGAAFAAMTPYRAIVGVEALGLSNAAFGLVMALNAIGGAAIAVFLGWLSDRVGDRRLLVLLCAIGGALGFLLVWSVQTPVGFATAFCLLIPFGNALFSQSFGYARAYYDREQPSRSQLIMSYLRSVFTIAWIIMPPLAGWLAAQTSSYSVFGMAALAHVGCTLAIALLFTDQSSRVGIKVEKGETIEPAKISSGHIIGLVGVTLSMVALQLNMALLPLVIVRDLSGTLGEVGLNAAVAAAIEVPVMIGWGYLALRWRKEKVLAISCMVFALYFLGMMFVESFFQVLALQVLAAIAIAALISISISYLQEAIPGRVGLSTSLVDVTRVVAAVAAAAIFAINPWATYAPIMGVAMIISIGASVALWAALRLTREMN